jgi:hypothetical protein
MKDIGFEQALIDWINKHHPTWKRENCGWHNPYLSIGYIHNESCTSNNNRSDNLLVHRLDDL